MNMRKIIYIIVTIFILQFLLRSSFVFVLSRKFPKLTNNIRLSEEEISYFCTSNYHVNDWSNQIERCPNGDIYVGRKAFVVDGPARIYSKDKKLIKEEASFSLVHRITPLYLWRTLTFQKIGCEEKEAESYCQNKFPTFKFTQ